MTNQENSKEVNYNSMLSGGINPYPYSFSVTHHAQPLQDVYSSLEPGIKTADIVSVAGRIMANRNNGMFMDVRDHTGDIQIFSHKQNLDSQYLSLIKMLDLGDYIGVVGVIRRTPKGELTINATQIEVLSKSIRPLPEKHHGLRDVETRYRKRYLDLIMSDDTREVLHTRSNIICHIRDFLLKNGFLEVETPLLHPIPGGASAKPFVTHHNALNADLYLRVAPELYLKRLIIGGLSDKIFEIGRNFRNEGISSRHNPEFTMLELYKAYSDYQDIMSLTEDIIVSTVKKINDGSTSIKFDRKTVNFAKPWKKASMTGLIKEATDVDFLTFASCKDSHDAAKDLGIKVSEELSWGQIVELAFEQFVEKTLINPTHVTDIPRDISPLAKAHRSNSLLTERFETFINGWEIANAFSELNDPFDQKRRFQKQSEMRESGDEEAQAYDADFIEALEIGMPPTGGLGIGIDRLVMLLTDSQNIRDVIAFPTLKPVK